MNTQKKEYCQNHQARCTRSSHVANCHEPSASSGIGRPLPVVWLPESYCMRFASARISSDGPLVVNRFVTAIFLFNNPLKNEMTITTGRENLEV